MAESGSGGKSRLTFGCLAAVVFVVVVAGGIMLMRGGSGGILGLFRKDDTIVDFHDLAPAGLVVHKVQRVDTDGDEELEWVVTYQYDRVGGLNPVAVAVYDAESEGGLPSIIPYPLKVPGEQYLGEGEVSIVQEDLVKDSFAVKTALELVVVDQKTLSVFAVADVNPVKTGKATEYPNPYSCQGFFRAEQSIARAGNVISVWDRADYDRSQLSLVRVYKPLNGSYFVEGTTTLRPPVEARIDFSGGMPEDILSTPYPEKIVLAFYNTLSEADGDLSPYLNDHGQRLLISGGLAYGSPWSRLQLDRALVQEISYRTPESDPSSPVDISADPESAVVSVKVSFIGPNGERVLRHVDWHAVKVGTQWKLHDAVASDA